MKLDQKKYYKIIALLLIMRLRFFFNEEFEIGVIPIPQRARTLWKLC
jgi:hypothetical protein